MRTEQIKQSIDLADYVRTCGIELKAHGKNNLKGLCPFHNDHNPSLIITPSKKLFNCPVCNKGGSVIDFAMFHHNVDLKEVPLGVKPALLRFSIHLSSKYPFSHHSFRYYSREGRIRLRHKVLSFLILIVLFSGCF